MKLNYREIGEGKPMVILHGLFGSSDNWLTMAKRLGKFRKLYLIDQRNHGSSPHSETFTYEAMAKDLKDFIIEHDLEKPEILGHSMGGKTAMQFAANYPELLSKLIVVDIAPKYYPVHHQTILSGLRSLNLKTLESRGEADEALASYIPVTMTRQFLLKNLRRDADGFAWKINLKVIEDNIENVGKALISKHMIECPTLFIRGSESDYITDEDQELIEEFFNDARIVTIEGAGHWIHAEQPDELCQIIEDFIHVD